VWIDERRGHAVDWITQRWVEHTGRLLEVQSVPWLGGPHGSTHGIGADFFERWGEANGFATRPPVADEGLLESLAALDSPSFDAAAVHPLIRDFYTRTSAFNLEIGSRWMGPFRVLGWLISRLFAKRLSQLNVPLSSHELRGGIESRLVKLCDSEGKVCHVGWVRTSIGSGLPVFVGRYGIAHLPEPAGACLQVVFPLPNGNAIILLRPRVEPGGGLTLLSEGAGFGDPGFYFTVLGEPGTLWARNVRTMKEQLSLRVEGMAVHGRHRFWVFGLPFMELTYRITEKACASASAEQRPRDDRKLAKPFGATAPSPVDAR
jgi:hypothetical protein